MYDIQSDTLMNLKNFTQSTRLVSIVIPVLNDPVHIDRCLASIFKSKNAQFECIVVDDGSTDTTAQVAKAYPVRLIQLPRNHGPAYARNIGAKTAKSDILFFIDADVLIYPDTLSKIIDFFSSCMEYDAVIGAYDDAPADTSFMSQFKNLFHHYVHMHGNEHASSFWSGCGAIRRRGACAGGQQETGQCQQNDEALHLGLPPFLHPWSNHAAGRTNYTKYVVIGQTVWHNTGTTGWKIQGEEKQTTGRASVG